MGNESEIVILGGGPAGLAVGYHAKKSGLPFTIYEAGPRIGGNCITIQHDGFYFDSGAHRFHDKDPQATRDIKELVGTSLHKIHVPSQIFSQGKLIAFPLSPLNLLKNLGAGIFFRAALEVLRSRFWKRAARNENFEDFARHTYGPTLAQRFLLNYSQKLWGMPCTGLSPDIAGNRMKGLDLKTFIKEAILGRKTRAEHLDGSFYYPEQGIGQISDSLAQACGRANIRLDARVTGVLHSSSRIEAVEINEKEQRHTPRLVSTLPLNRLLQIMKPPPAGEFLDLAEALRYRSVLLAVLFIHRQSVSEAATVYFPDAGFTFTRLYEPRNRSAAMAPPGKTALVLEIPCQEEDSIWQQKDEGIIRQLLAQLVDNRLIEEREVIGSQVVRMRDAYPILELGYKERVNRVFGYLERFENLRLSGRSGRFVYAHVHDMMRFAREIVDDIA